MQIILQKIILLLLNHLNIITLLLLNYFTRNAVNSSTAHSQIMLTSCQCCICLLRSRIFYLKAFFFLAKGRLKNNLWLKVWALANFVFQNPVIFSLFIDYTT